MNKKTKGAISLGKIYGIEIELHYTWFFIFALLAWGLSAVIFPGKDWYPGLPIAVYWILGAISAVLLFASVLLHELTHSIVAKLFKMPVKKITLFFFGGVAQIEGEDLTPKKEFWMAIAGPLFSIALGFLFLIIFKFSTITYVSAISRYLYLINFILAGFNLLPGFPLDGGRVLRSILWKIYNNERKATKIAAYGGKAVAVLMIIFGFLGFFGIGIQIEGFILGGFWFIIIGIFLWMIANASYQQTALKSLLTGLTVNQVMNKKPVTVTETTTVKDLLRKFINHRLEAVTVTKNNKVIGMATLAAIKGIQKNEWTKRKVRSLMKRRITPAKPKEQLFRAFAKMIEQGLDVLPVTEKKKLVGALHKGTIIHILRIRSHIS